MLEAQLRLAKGALEGALPEIATMIEFVDKCGREEEGDALRGEGTPLLMGHMVQLPRLLTLGSDMDLARREFEWFEHRYTEDRSHAGMYGP